MIRAPEKARGKARRAATTGSESRRPRAQVDVEPEVLQFVTRLARHKSPVTMPGRLTQLHAEKDVSATVSSGATESPDAHADAADKASREKKRNDSRPSTRFGVIAGVGAGYDFHERALAAPFSPTDHRFRRTNREVHGVQSLHAPNHLDMSVSSRSVGPVGKLSIIRSNRTDPPSRACRQRSPW